LTTLGEWVAGARPRTLPAAVVPVAVGTSAADLDGAPIWWRAGAALVVSLFLQIGVNYANDYSDGVRGTDDDRVGPMRLVATGAASANAVKWAALGAFLVAAVTGLALASVTSWWLIAVGAVSILAAWTYTGGPKPYGYLGFGELFVFVFFGVVATSGTTFVQDESVTMLGLGAAVPVGLLAVGLLITNNLRDRPRDAAAGKKTLAVRVGDRPTRVIYVAVIAGVFLCLPYLAIVRPGALIGLLAVPLAIRPVRIVLGGAEGPALIPVLAATSRLQLGVGLLLTIGLAISA
jgi:1,4-dihydroxy-2-naphthoate polyprenyltransferase